MATAQTRPSSARPTHGIDHVTIGVREYAAGKRFYELALRPLGFAVRLDWPDAERVYLGVGSEGSSLWVTAGRPARAELSLAAADRVAVDAFYAAALAAGGRPVSPPAVRPEYTRSTYAAAVLDPDGNSIEAICRSADAEARAAA
jgi:catechol 2,3-dioxygenase-like lactoylglutathione lyase family enzyme